MHPKIFQKILQGFLDWLSPILAAGAFYQRLLVSVLIILGIFGLRLFFLRFVKSTQQDRRGLQKWRYNSLYASLLLIGLILIPIWNSSIRNALALLGIFGAGVLIVFKELLLSLIGRLYLLLRRPFEVGNRIMIDGKIGDVFEIRMLDFSMIEVQARENGGQSTGRVIHVPNSMVLTHVLSNASKQFAFNWNEIAIPLTPQSNWKLAETIILDVANSVLEEVHRNDDRISFSEEEYAIRYKHLTPVVYVSFTDGVILLVLRHLTEPRKTRILTDKIWREILTRFRTKKQIELAK